MGIYGVSSKKFTGSSPNLHLPTRSNLPKKGHLNIRITCSPLNLGIHRESVEPTDCWKLEHETPNILMCGSIYDAKCEKLRPRPGWHRFLHRRRSSTFGRKPTLEAPCRTISVNFLRSTSLFGQPVTPPLPAPRKNPQVCSINIWSKSGRTWPLDSSAWSFLSGNLSSWSTPGTTIQTTTAQPVVGKQVPTKHLPRYSQRAFQASPEACPWYLQVLHSHLPNGLHQGIVIRVRFGPPSFHHPKTVACGHASILNNQAASLAFLVFFFFCITLVHSNHLPLWFGLMAVRFGLLASLLPAEQSQPTGNWSGFEVGILEVSVMPLGACPIGSHTFGRTRCNMIWPWLKSRKCPAMLSFNRIKSRFPVSPMLQWMQVKSSQSLNCCIIQNCSLSWSPWDSNKYKNKLPVLKELRIMPAYSREGPANSTQLFCRVAPESAALAFLKDAKTNNPC